ncbi:MAG TPA: ABC transporter substrate-binding protein [Dermatophilaceae bacterium]|nr:ABC transporter substrate-binding protein [Dermatophilaceae bacterium]
MNAQLDPSAQFAAGISRRMVLQALAAGAVTMPMVAACTGTSTPPTTGSTGGSAAGAKSVTLGSSASDAVPKAAIAAMVAGAKAAAGVDVKVNTVPHNDFQNNINNYLKGSPDDVFTWFAGFRMRTYAAQGLAAPIDDVWAKIGSKFADSFAQASTGDDGKKYFVPLYNYPWAVFYRPTVFQKFGYTAPKTLDELAALCQKMKGDNLTPIAFGDKDGWPAFGTFDYINMRQNGYDFHIELMAHKHSWEDPKVKAVFDTWKRLLPYHATGSLGRTWEEAAQTVVKKTSGMYLLGSFVGQQWPKGDTDIDFFPFPAIDTAHGQDAIEAPIDGFMLSLKGANNPAAKDLLAYIGSAKAADTYLATDSNDVAAVNDADTSKYTPLQKKAAELISSAKSISQFLDRDADPAFANNAALPAFQNFIKNGDIDATCKSLEAQAKQIYPA